MPKTRGPEGFLKAVGQKGGERARASAHGADWEPRARLTMSSAQLRANFETVAALVPHQSVLAMIKANAYGHGATWAAGILADQPQLYGLGVATLEEGAQVRQALGAKRRRVPILVLAETCPWTEEKGAFCESHALTAVLDRDEDFKRFVQGGWPARVPYEIFFNTGMNRLGLGMGLLHSVEAALKKMKPEQRPQGVLSHLACAEDPDHRVTRAQVEAFKKIRGALKAVAPGAHFHLANSAGVWNAQRLGLRDLTEVVRPGLSLYGAAPWEGAPTRGLGAVMTLEAQVACLHALKGGESIGYGARFTAQAGGRGVIAAVLSAGYADGVLRGLSPQGHAWLGDRTTRYLGAISMDLSAVEANSSTRVGDWVQILGPQLDPWQLARAAGTIPYELYTSISPRVKRLWT